MSSEPLVLHAFRKEDFLSLTFELRNLQLQGEPSRLVRVDPAQKAFVIIHFPSQHIQEQVFIQDTNILPVGPAPVEGTIAGESRLAFQLPDELESLDFSLQALLEWTQLLPSLPAQALPPQPDGFFPAVPAPAEPEDTQTAIEFPTGLVLSPDSMGTWVHASQPVTHNGRTEIWHTRLGVLVPQADGSHKVVEPGPAGEEMQSLPHVRAIWNRGAPMPFGQIDPIKQGPLTAQDRQDLTNLSGNFTLRSKWEHPFIPIPAQYQPRPIDVRRLMLTPGGAWADLEGSWDYPLLNDDFSLLTGYPPIKLVSWKHQAAGGRDYYVRAVYRGVLGPTANRAVRVKVTERVFEPQLVRTEQTPHGPVGIFGSVAYLRQYEFIVVQEPKKDYAVLSNAYLHNGRELPYCNLTIQTRVTPMLDQSMAPGDYVMVGGKEFLFKFSGEDVEGNSVSFELPLRYYETQDWATIVNQYNNIDPVNLRTADLANQKLAFVPSDPGKPDDAGLKVKQFTFGVEAVDGAHADFLPHEHPLFLPTMERAEVGIPAVERMLGGSNPQEITLHPAYLLNGLDRATNHGEVYAKLTLPLPLPFSSEKGGGLAKPQSLIDGLSRAVGPISNPDQILNGVVDTSPFDQARILGTIPLKKLLQDNQAFSLDTIDLLQTFSEEQLTEWLKVPGNLLSAPMLTTRRLPNAVETRYLWKPALVPSLNLPAGLLTLKTQGVFPDGDGDLLLQAHLLTKLQGGETAMDIYGRMRNFSLIFGDFLELKLRSLSFTAGAGKKVDLSADGLELVFMGALEFVNTLKDILPANGFSDPPALTVDASGIRAGFSLGVPSVGVGIFSIQNITLSAALTIPFIDSPAGVRFGISERHKPFLVTVTLFGGGGFFALALNAKGVEQIEAAIEFGGNISLNLGIASGGVYVMAGIYFSLTSNQVMLTGYLRCGGYLEVLGLICISIEFYLGFTYLKKDSGGEAWGQATVTVKVEIAFFSKSVSLTVEKRFAGAAGDPTFEDVIAPTDWEEYVLAFG